MSPKDDSFQALTLRLPADEYEALRTFAFVSKQSINEAVRRAIRVLLATEGARGDTYAMFDAAKGSYKVVVSQISKEVKAGSKAEPKRR